MNYITIEVQNTLISNFDKEKIKDMCTSQFYIMTELNIETMFPRNNLFFDRLVSFKENAIISKLKGNQYKNGILPILQKPDFVDWHLFITSIINIDMEIIDISYDVKYITLLKISNKYYEAIPSKSRFIIYTKKKYNINQESNVGYLTNRGFGKIKIF